MISSEEYFRKLIDGDCEEFYNDYFSKSYPARFEEFLKQLKQLMHVLVEFMKHYKKLMVQW